MNTRRHFFQSAGIAGGALAAAAISRLALAALPEPVLQNAPDTMPPLAPPNGRPYRPVLTLNGWTTALAHARRCEGIPSGGRAGGTRNGARL